MLDAAVSSDRRAQKDSRFEVIGAGTGVPEDVSQLGSSSVVPGSTHACDSDHEEPLWLVVPSVLFSVTGDVFECSRTPSLPAQQGLGLAAEHLCLQPVVQVRSLGVA